ncbi:RiPP maturation radical SAM C-methyltransferase [Sorangium sp. So ce1153]|uniref:RiPP maturation radical SAM C-methyltransferase n=1 Tax=Sorangium sp. So ce1153 TaxID=3133333 RepID=UPI003F5DCC6F
MIRLVNMPFGSLLRPPLALGLIQAQLRGAGLPASTLHLTFDFARLIGFGAYESIAFFKGVETQVGEWLFAEAAWRRRFGPGEEEFLARAEGELRNIAKVPDPAAWLLRIRREIVGPFLEHAYRRVIEGGVPRAVGFSCMFFQTISALALGRLLKERHPEIKLVYGGACFHGEMGEELLRKAPWIDAVSTGEADDVIVPLFRALAAGETPRELHGILARDAGGTVVTGPPAAPVGAAVLEALPDPSFDEFFADAARVALDKQPSWQERVAVPFEASRGCWYGQKKHCTFCGLNGEGMTYRSKSAERVRSTLASLAARYPVRSLQGTDNILATDAWRALLPRLAEQRVRSRGRAVDLFFEVKPNLDRDEIRALADAGVTFIQPGIESLSSRLLSLMGKGVSALQNVFLLKCCSEYGITPYWNVLIRVPGESAEDYAAMAAWIPLLAHLRPPSGGVPKVELHRFSPYFTRRGVWTEDVRPARWYAALFPEDTVELDKVAYYFDATWKDTLGDPAYDELLGLLHVWMGRFREQPEPPRLVMRDEAGGGLAIEDTRSAAPATHRLDPVEAAIYRAVTDIATPRRARALLPAELAERLDEEAVRARLRALVAAGLAIVERDRFLGLALPPAAREVPLAERRVAVRRVAGEAPRRLPVVA